MRAPFGFAALVVTAALGTGCGVGGTTTVTIKQGLGSLQSAASLESRCVAVVKRVAPSVVRIEASTGLGSSEILDTQGNIVTNAHVVGSDTSFAVTLADGRHVTGRLVGLFAPYDLAVIRIPGGGLQPIAVASSAKLQVGDIVLAIGSPRGLQSSVTEGIVSALGRTVSEPTGTALPGAIQSSAAINPGNSGGALVTSRASWSGSRRWRLATRRTAARPPASASPSPATRSSRLPGN
ncbi:MAG TPA: trypsin-like peptidase domain-containing protein [Gaiellales bacterium]|nr:trypsin-like peptidase domain-containing protein [Gaiellales bacterium]